MHLRKQTLAAFPLAPFLPLVSFRESVSKSSAKPPTAAAAPAFFPCLIFQRQVITFFETNKN